MTSIVCDDTPGNFIGMCYYTPYWGWFHTRPCPFGHLSGVVTIVRDHDWHRRNLRGNGTGLEKKVNINGEEWVVYEGEEVKAEGDFEVAGGDLELEGPEPEGGNLEPEGPDATGGNVHVVGNNGSDGYDYEFPSYGPPPQPRQGDEEEGGK